MLAPNDGKANDTFSLRAEHDTFTGIDTVVFLDTTTSIESKEFMVTDVVVVNDGVLTARVHITPNVTTGFYKLHFINSKTGIRKTDFPDAFEVKP